MEITIHQISLWVWIIGALVLMPVLAYVFAKSDLERSKVPEPWAVAPKLNVKEVFWSAFIGSVFWPVILGLGLVAMILVGPTFTVISKVRKDHEKRVKEAETERDVLARLEEEKEAEEARINRELGIEPELTVNQGIEVAIQKESQNQKWLKGKKLILEGGRLEIELDWDNKAFAAAKAEAEEVRKQALLVTYQSERRRRMRQMGLSMNDIEQYERTAGSENRRLFE